MEEEKVVIENYDAFNMMYANGHGITIGDKIAIGFDRYDEDYYERIMWFTVVSFYIGWYEDNCEYRPVYIIRDDNNEFYRLFTYFDVPLNDSGTKEVYVVKDEGDEFLPNFGEGTILGINCGDGSFMFFDNIKSENWPFTKGLDITLDSVSVSFRFEGLKETVKDKDGRLVLVFDPKSCPDGFDRYMSVNTIYSTVSYAFYGLVVDERHLFSAKSIDKSCIKTYDNAKGLRNKRRGKEN